MGTWPGTATIWGTIWGVAPGVAFGTCPGTCIGARTGTFAGVGGTAPPGSWLEMGTDPGRGVVGGCVLPPQLET
jgi:hypothetical protein